MEVDFSECPPTSSVTLAEKYLAIALVVFTITNAIIIVAMFWALSNMGDIRNNTRNIAEEGREYAAQLRRIADIQQGAVLLANLSTPVKRDNKPVTLTLYWRANQQEIDWLSQWDACLPVVER